MRQTVLQTVAEALRQLDHGKVPGQQECSPYPCIEPRAPVAESAVARHGLHLDAAQRIIDVRVVLATKLPTIHWAWRRVKGALGIATPYPSDQGWFRQ